MDCSYMVKVPLFCPDAPCPAKTPVILSAWDRFQKPLPFQPDVLVPYDHLVDTKIKGCMSHVSQFYEWLPYVGNWENILAAPTFEEKTTLLWDYFYNRFSNCARLYPERIPAGSTYVEAFEWNEYGAPLDDALRRAMTE